MRKPALYLAAWFTAGVLAVTLANVGVSMVTEQVTGDRPSPLSAAQVSDELAGAADTTTTVVGVATTTTTTPASPGATDGGGSTDSSATTPGDGGSSGSGSGSSSGSGSGTPPTTATTAPAPAPPVTRTYAMVGGTATLRFTASGVTVLAATPNAGFSVKISDVHDGGARVEFEGEDHRSRVDGWWAGGPQDEVREED